MTEDLSDLFIDLREIWKGFKGSHGITEILRGLSLALHLGDSIGITGASGAGKSTFLNILTALERPDKGQILWNGSSIASWSRSQIAHYRALSIGFVFQSYHLFPELNVLENILLSVRIAKSSVKKQDIQKAKDLLGRLGLASHWQQLPSTLSGGERQRVAIARAFMLSPKLIIADEPTGNLDEASAENVMRLLEEVSHEEHTALLLVTHHIPFVKRMQRCYHLHQGILEAI